VTWLVGLELGGFEKGWKVSRGVWGLEPGGLGDCCLSCVWCSEVASWRLEIGDCEGNSVGVWVCV
jgi:hypothetical protein